MGDGKDEKALDGVIAQGRHLFGQIKQMCEDTDKFIWPANPDDVETVLLLHPFQHDHLQAFLLESNKSFSSNADQITSITDVRASIVITTSIPTPDMYVKPKGR